MARTREAWIAAHPYLAAAGEVARRFEAALRGIAVPPAPAPPWEAYAAEHREGVPVLESARAGVDLVPAGAMAAALVESLAGDPGPLAGDLDGLAAELRTTGDAPRRIAAFLRDGEGFDAQAPGLLRCLGWLSAARYLRPVRESYEAWRDEESWLRPYCPLCGSRPAMAQLSGSDPGRKRRLVCGGCDTRWQFRRTQCPFCEHDSQKLSSVAIQGEGGLRIDWCESCRGYLKTYDGEGEEDVLLADWTSLHVDLVARERGLERMASSLYALDDPTRSADGTAREETIGAP